MDKDIKEKLREDWKKVEKNAEVVYFNKEQADNLINAVEKCKDTEVRDIDVISKIERGTEKLKELLDKNIKRDLEGKVLLSKDDEWREEVEWDELIKAVNEDNPDNEDRHCTVEESLRESLKQMKLMREGKMPKRNWDDFRKEMDKTNKKYSKALSNLSDNDYKKDTAWNEFYNECELDIVSTIFDNNDEENMNEQDIKRLVEEEMIYREMRDREYFDKNFLFDDEDLQEVYKEMLDCNDSKKS